MARSSALTARLGTLPSLLLRALFLVLPAFPVHPAHAQGWIEIERPVEPGAPVAEIERTGSQVRIAVDGRVARVEVEERFRNSGSRLAEGSYLYPMPGEAVFTNSHSGWVTWRSAARR